MKIGAKRGRPFAKKTALNAARVIYDSFREDARKTKSLPAFAAVLGIKPRTYRAYERGERAISKTKVVRICAILGVRRDSLVDASRYVRLDIPLHFTGAPLSKPLLQAWISRARTTDQTQLRTLAVKKDKQGLLTQGKQLVESAAQQVQEDVGNLLSAAGLAKFEEVLLAVRESLDAIADEHGFQREFRRRLEEHRSLTRN